MSLQGLGCGGSWTPGQTKLKSRGGRAFPEFCCAPIQHGVTVAEVTYSNSISVTEHVVMMILGLVRNYIPSHDWVRMGEACRSRRLASPT